MTQTIKNSTYTIDSLEIAEMLGTEHWKLLRKLEGTDKFKGIIQILGDNKIVVSDFFIKSTYLSEQNKELPCYQFTKLGCDFIANKFSGEKGILFTAKYVKRFHSMETALLEYQPKMTSLGEIASYIKVVTRFMKEQGSTPEQIMQAIDDINIQFGIRLPKLAKVNPWEQMTIICIRQ